MERDERGNGLVEMMLVLLTVAILLGMSIPIVSTLFDLTGRIDNTYTNVSQQVVLSTLPERLVRSAVAPDPNPSGGTPIPAFVAGSLTANSMTFYANMGNANGPDEVTAGCTAGTTSECSGPFTVAVTPPTAGSCPFSTSATNLCQYASSSAKTIVSVSNVVNTTSQPIFIYSYGSVEQPGQSMIVTAVAPSADSSTFTSCAASTNPSQPYANCLAGEVQEVAFDLVINVNTSSRHGGLTVEEDSSVFTLSAISMTYDPSVG